MEVMNNLQSKDYKKDKVGERKGERASLPSKFETKLFGIQEGAGENKKSTKFQYKPTS